MRFFLTLSVFLMAVASAHAEDVDAAPDISSWGFDVGFGNQPYMSQATRFGVLSPFLFSGGKSDWRLTLDVLSKTSQSFSSASIAEYSLSLEANSRVYKDVAYSFVKFGVGAMDLDDDLYDGTILVVPVSLGLQVITHSSQRYVSSIFVDYRFMAYTNYDFDKSLPKSSTVGIDKHALFSGMTSVGVRFLF